MNAGAKIELVVARCQEDLKWLRRTPDPIHVIVYNKGAPCDFPARRVSPVESSTLPNLGREAHTYLHHIVNGYDRLADLTVFSQGKPFDHVPDFHHRLRALAEGGPPFPDFQWWGFVLDWDDARGERLFTQWSKNEDRRGLDMTGFLRALDLPAVPSAFVFYPGAHFAVTREAIHARPLSFYRKALKVAGSFPDAAHCFERTWATVFLADRIVSGVNPVDLPRYSKPIRRLMNADGGLD